MSTATVMSREELREALLQSEEAKKVKGTKKATSIKAIIPPIGKKNDDEIQLMMLNTADLEATGLAYQRMLDNKKIAQIVSNFNPHKFGIPKVSFRDGKYYVYDGQHRVIAIKTLKGTDCFIQCEVHFGLTYEDEAKLFAEQYDGATKVDFMYRWRAYYEGKTEPVYSIVNAVRAIGIEVPFTKAKAPHRITALSELNKMWIKLKEEQTLRILGLLNTAWDDDMNAFNKNIIDGMKEFFYVYGNEIDDATFVKQMRKTTPIKIEANGRSDMISKGGLKYAKVIWTAYNNGLKTRRLDYKFKG